MTTAQINLQQVKALLRTIKDDPELIQLFADINTAYYDALIKNGFDKDSAVKLTCYFDFLKNK